MAVWHIVLHVIAGSEYPSDMYILECFDRVKKRTKISQFFRPLSFQFLRVKHHHYVNHHCHSCSRAVLLISDPLSLFDRGVSQEHKHGKLAPQSTPVTLSIQQTSDDQPTPDIMPLQTSTQAFIPSISMHPLPAPSHPVPLRNTLLS